MILILADTWQCGKLHEHLVHNLAHNRHVDAWIKEGFFIATPSERLRLILAYGHASSPALKILQPIGEGRLSEPYLDLGHPRGLGTAHM